MIPLQQVSNSTVNTTTVSQKNICDEISSKIASFQQQKGKWITPNCQYIQEGNVHYYGIHKSRQMQAQDGIESVLLTRQCYQEMKSHVLQNMKLQPDTKVIQVVGGCSSFSKEGTERAKEFLRSQLKKDSLVLYGYAGMAESDGARCVNAAVSDVIFEENMQLQGQTVANLVGFHTPTALKEWGYSGPDLQHYVIVYGDDETSRETGTVFGDDVITSDFFADSLLMLEGGVQSFRQACNALLHHQKITVLPDLRAPSKALAKEFIRGDSEREPREILTPYFGSAKFLKDLTVFISENNGNVSETMLQGWYRNYFGQGKCYVVDLKKGNSDTKQKLLNDAWDLFIKEKLYLKIQTLVSYQ